MSKSIWTLNIPKSDFKVRMKQGDVEKDIDKARKMIEDDKTDLNKIEVLDKHVKSLYRAISIIRSDDKDAKNKEFIAKNFGAREENDFEKEVEMPESVTGEN